MDTTSTEPTEDTAGHIYTCSHRSCNYRGPREDFLSRTGTQTKLCKYCREKARLSMNQVHARRKAGIKVARGRRPIGSGTPLTVYVPAEIYDKALKMFTSLVCEHYQDKGLEVPEAYNALARFAPTPSLTRKPPKPRDPDSFSEEELTQLVADWKAAFPEYSKQYDDKPKKQIHRAKHWHKGGRMVNGKPWRPKS